MLLVVYAIPAFVVLLALEIALSRRRPVLGYELRDSVASISMGLGNLGLLVFTKAASLALFFALYEHRLFAVPLTAVGIVALLVCEDFCYYWFHRGHHEVRLL